MSWVGQLMRAGINAKSASIELTKPLEFDSSVALPQLALTISGADQGDGTTDVTFQVQDPAGNNFSGSAFMRIWVGTADDYGVDAITGISATTGTIVHSHTSNADVDVVTDSSGTALLAMNNGGAGTIYMWAAMQGRVYASGGLSIT